MFYTFYRRIFRFYTFYRRIFFTFFVFYRKIFICILLLLVNFCTVKLTKSVGMLSKFRPFATGDRYVAREVKINFLANV